MCHFVHVTKITLHHWPMLQWAVTVHGILTRCSTYDPRQKIYKVYSPRKVKKTDITITISYCRTVLKLIKMSEITPSNEHDDESTHLKEFIRSIQPDAPNTSEIENTLSSKAATPMYWCYLSSCAAWHVSDHISIYSQKCWWHLFPLVFLLLLIYMVWMLVLVYLLSCTMSIVLYVYTPPLVVIYCWYCHCYTSGSLYLYI